MVGWLIDSTIGYKVVDEEKVDDVDKENDEA